MPSRIPIIFILAFAIANFTSANSAELNEYNYNYSQNVYGGVGLVVTPSARFDADGEFAFGVSSESPYNRLYGKSQFFPWLEAVLRYTEETYFSYGRTGVQTNKDKGIDFKFRLLTESEKLPQIAMGFSDLGGTGRYSSEYFVASKRIGDFDFTLGLGWGSLSGVNHFSNPFTIFDEQKKIRGGYGYGGGKINFTRLFSGSSSSLFGGFEYFTPINNLSLKLEYDSSDYSDALGEEKKFYETGNVFDIDSRINYALNYRRVMSDRDKLDFSLGLIRGNTFYANFTVHSNLNQKGEPKVIIGPEKIRNTNLRVNSFIELDENRRNFLTNRIIKEMASNGFVTHRVIFDGTELAAEVSQARFLETSKFLDLASRILANNSLPNIETVTVINIEQGIETLRSSVRRKELVSAVAVGPLPEELIDYDQNSPFSDKAIFRDNNDLYPNLFWSIRPIMTGTIQHQERFYFWQLQALLHAEYSIKKGLTMTTDIGINIDNNFDGYNYHIPDGELYHVRQDRRKYLTEGETGLRRLSIDYLFDINANLKAKVSAGYLEWMYGGVGGELLYLPNHRRWGLGMDAYWVKQREFNQRFSFKDYDTTTLFLSYYRDIPFYDLRLKIHMGRFLGKDKGAHIDISRRFKTGARVGGIIALTDCDAQCVGEGSFNKWIYFQLPMDLFYVNSTTKDKTGYYWSPLTKDAGQRVEAGSLYYLMTDSADQIDSIRQKQFSIKKIFSGFGTSPKKKI